MPLRQRTGGKLRCRSPAHEERGGQLRHQWRHDASPRRRADERSCRQARFGQGDGLFWLPCRREWLQDWAAELCSRTGKRAEKHILTDGGPAGPPPFAFLPAVELACSRVEPTPEARWRLAFRCLSRCLPSFVMGQRGQEGNARPLIVLRYEVRDLRI